MKTRFSLFLSLCICLTFAFCKKDKTITDAPTTNPETSTGTKELAIEVVAKNLKLPWGLAYLPDGSLLFTEREGRINLLKKGESAYKTILTRQVNTVSEGGLLSIAVDPQFSTNHFIYIYETLGTSYNHVVQLTLNGETASEVKVIVDSIPYSVNHDGGALKFGPDGYLYIGTGDAQQQSLPQNTNSLAGKILRVTRDGITAPNNPFNNLVWSYGHRNVQGFTWMPGGQMLATEHGPSGENGWCCHDEVNLIEAGKNYGWPLQYAGNESNGKTPAVIHSGDDTWAPSGCTWLGATSIWPNSLAVASLRGQRIIRISFNGTTVTSKSDTLKDVFNRIRNVVEAPDGSLVFCTSNIGSNSVLAEDDKIYRLYRK